VNGKQEAAKAKRKRERNYVSGELRLAFSITSSFPAHVFLFPLTLFGSQQLDNPSVPRIHLLEAQVAQIDLVRAHLPEGAHRFRADLFS